MIFMYKVSNNLVTANLLSHFKKVNESHGHNTRKNKNNFNIRFARTTKKSCKYKCKGAKVMECTKYGRKIVQQYCSIQEKYKCLLLEKYKV